MSATRPAIEFSIGIMPRSALPFWIAVSASSKVGHGTVSQLGYTSRDAISEFAPGSPWNAIFSLLMTVFPSAAEQGAGLFQVFGGVDAENDVRRQRDVDTHAGLERAQLLEPLAALQRRGRQRDETGQRG